MSQPDSPQGSTRVSRVFGGPSQKLTRTEICKNFSTQLGPNPWRVGLAHRFQPIFTILIHIMGIKGIIKKFKDYLLRIDVEIRRSSLIYLIIRGIYEEYNVIRSSLIRMRARAHTHTHTHIYIYIYIYIYIILSKI